MIAPNAFLSSDILIVCLGIRVEVGLNLGLGLPHLLGTTVVAHRFLLSGDGHTSKFSQSPLNQTNFDQCMASFGLTLSGLVNFKTQRAKSSNVVQSKALHGNQSEIMLSHLTTGNRNLSLLWEIAYNHCFLHHFTNMTM